MQQSNNKATFLNDYEAPSSSAEMEAPPRPTTPQPVDNSDGFTTWQELSWDDIPKDDTLQALQALPIPQFDGDFKIQIPFPHQVAGHDALLQAEEGLMCKPLIERELWFYLNAMFEHKQYIPYLPTILGCVEYKQEDVLEFTSNFLLRENSPPELSNADSISKEDSEDDIGSADETLDVSDIGPWAKTMHEKLLANPNNNRITENKRYRFLVMKDLSFGFSKPCVLDLKIGTRQHGDDAPPAKQKSQSKKCRETTSVPLGLRICGFQVYHTTKSSYDRFDKYEGRKLTVSNFSEALARFFSNGNEIRFDILKQFLVKVKEIEALHKSSHSFRIYSSSLLFMYEGDETISNPKGIILKMIDFAHTHSLVDGDVQDDGYLFGIDKLIQTLQKIQ